LCVDYDELRHGKITFCSEKVLKYGETVETNGRVRSTPLSSQISKI